MKKTYFFILKASSSGGDIIACFPSSKKKDALEFVKSDKYKFNGVQYLSLYTGLWDGYGEFPRGNLTKY